MSVNVVPGVPPPSSPEPWNIVVATFGALILILVSIDIAWTTLSITRNGVITVVLTDLTTLFCFRIPAAVIGRIDDAVKRRRRRHRKLHPHEPHPPGIRGPTTTLAWRLYRRFLTIFGPLVLLMTLWGWILIFIFAWTMVHYAYPNNLYNPITFVTIPITGADSFRLRFYYCAYTFGTLAFGDVLPYPGGWQIVANVMSLTGIITIGLIIAYILSVIPTVLSLRRISSVLSSVGSTPVEMLRIAWNGSDFKQFYGPLDDLLSDVAQLSEYITTWPSVLLFRGLGTDRNLMLRLVALDETITILQYALRRNDPRFNLENILPSPMSIIAMKRAISMYIRVMRYGNAYYDRFLYSGFLPNTLPKGDSTFYEARLPILPPSLTYRDIEFLEYHPNSFCRILGKQGIPRDLFDLDAYHEALYKPRLRYRRYILKLLLTVSGLRWKDIKESELNASTVIDVLIEYFDPRVPDPDVEQEEEEAWNEKKRGVVTKDAKKAAAAAASQPIADINQPNS